MNINTTQPDDPLNIKKKLSNKNARRQKRKRLNKQGRKEFKRHTKLSQTMSTWAETFTLASNWQMKHQLAHWKARAKALEYENSILHDIIRKNYLASSSNTENKVDESEVQSNPTDNETNADYNSEEIEPECDQYSENEEEVNEEDFEVSEEFIEFLRTNAKYKEDARLERERLKAKQEEEETQEESSEMKIMSHDQLKELYGEKWQRISALQMSLVTDFMNKSDELKPVYWPNIPFNFNYS